MHRLGSLIRSGLLAVAIAFLAAPAAAQSEASATGKGITGGALLGAEVVMLTEAALGVDSAWAYVIGGVAGAAGGGVGGYFVEDTSAKASMLLLAGGMALVIPTTVAVLSATAYEPPADYTEDRGPTDEPLADPPQPIDGPTTLNDQNAPAPTATHKATRRRPRAKRLTLDRPPALLGYGADSGLLSLSIPAVEVRDVFTRVELATYGVKQQTEVRVPVLNVVF